MKIIKEELNINKSVYSSFYRSKSNTVTTKGYTVTRINNKDIVQSN